MIILNGLFNQFERLLRPYARKCWPKIQHTSRDAAVTHARALVSRGVHKDLASLRFYWCGECGSWHVGHLRTGT